MSDLKVVADPGTHEIVITRSFDAPRELVFKAFTDPEAVTRWWGLRDTETVVDELEARPGGRWRFVQRSGDGGEDAVRQERHAAHARRVRRSRGPTARGPPVFPPADAHHDPAPRGPDSRSGSVVRQDQDQALFQRSQPQREVRGGYAGRAGQPPPMMNVLFADCLSVRRRPMCCTIGSISRGRGSVTLTWSPAAR